MINFTFHFTFYFQFQLAPLHDGPKTQLAVLTDDKSQFNIPAIHQDLTIVRFTAGQMNKP
jgi:hypothetical protein